MLRSRKCRRSAPRRWTGLANWRRSWPRCAGNSRISAEGSSEPRSDETQAGALGRQDLAPLPDEFPVGFPDGTNLPIEIVQPKRVHVSVVLAQGGVPIHLIGKAVPGKAQQRDSVLFEAVDIRPLFL